MIKTPLSTMIGGAFWTPGATILGSSSKNLSQLIKSLFANNEQGFAYDPNDLTTLYQDAAGTIHVTAAGQPVGLVLDKSKGLVLSPNRCVNGDFSAGLSGWVSNGNYWTVVGGRAYHALGAVLNALDQVFTATTTTATYLEFTAEVLTAVNTAQVQFVPSGTTVNFTTGLQRIAVPVGTSNIQFKRVPATSAEFYIDNVSVRSVLGNHAYQTVSASRPILQRNATTGAYYLAFDGVDDFLQTNNINFTATDKVSLFAGVRKLSDGLFSTIAELGASDTVLGSFGVGCAGLVGDASRRTYNSNICGSSRVGHGVYVFTAPTSNVLSTQFDLSKNGAASTVMRVDCNTPQKVTENSNTGGGVYGNYPLFIGRRNGSIFPFSGHIYSLICISRLTTNAETLALEKAIAKLTGVALNV